MDEVLSNLILASVSLSKALDQVASRGYFQPWLSCDSVDQEELLFQRSNKNSGHWHILYFYTELNRKKAWKELMVKATEQLVEAINKQMFYGQEKETNLPSLRKNTKFLILLK